MTRKTGLVWHEIYMWHDTGTHAGVLPAGNPIQPGTHAENPETKRRFKNLLEVSGLYDQLVRIDPKPATDEQILRAHTPAYINRLKEESALPKGGDAGMLTPFGPGGFEIAALSAGGVIAAVDAVLDGKADNAYALVRPPGHHAEPDMGKGFCLLANAAIAGLHALEARGLKRIAYVDWDVHHGNGTERVFWEDPRALTISVHQDRNFPPDTGDMTDTGGGEGEDYNINIPLPAGSGVGAYEAVFDRVIIPALRAFKPDMIFVPSGFDAGAHDPLGRMMMHSEGYRSLTHKMRTIAEELCGGRLVMSHEGGYNAPTVPFYGLAVMEELSGIKTAVDDPFMPLFEGMGGQTLQPHQEAVITEACKLVERLK
ncbi:class II histone deacetylase [Kordiimonas pumila]|uniref:Class II histone deacetylase n=1 Tax=Kordiimonas pumila TaxID=2161677 RepID=A0ABV7D462_9PROT|nr:class II histone deacetylase [Kordiimonas pumila]